jgi:hypothetical protein
MIKHWLSARVSVNQLRCWNSLTLEEVAQKFLHGCWANAASEEDGLQAMVRYLRYKNITVHVLCLDHAQKK